MSKPEYHVASFSGGKDSTAMVLRMIELGYRLDEVLCCDTTMEFPAMERHIEKVKKVVENAGIKFTMLRAEHDFEHYMLHYQPKRRDTNKFKDKRGYSWPGPRSRWCTRQMKLDVMRRYTRELHREYDVIEYIGLAADEDYRLERENNQNEAHRHPLRDWGWTEADALAYCYDRGYDWEGLYEIFSRVSCWCCPLASLSEFRKLRTLFPDLWQRLKDLDAQTWRDFLKDGWTVERLDKRFSLEEVLTEKGYSTKDKRFFVDLRRHCFDDVPVNTILAERETGA